MHLTLSIEANNLLDEGINVHVSKWTVPRNLVDAKKTSIYLLLENHRTRLGSAQDCAIGTGRTLFLHSVKILKMAERKFKKSI